MEREVVHALLDAGISAERVPLSGAAGGSYTGDISFAAVPGKDWIAEVKARASGFATLYTALEGARLLFLTNADGKPVAVLTRLTHFLDVRSNKHTPTYGTTISSKTFPRQLCDWLGANDALFLRRNRSPWLCVIPLDRWMELSQ